MVPLWSILSFFWVFSVTQQIVLLWGASDLQGAGKTARVQICGALKHAWWLKSKTEQSSQSVTRLSCYSDATATVKPVKEFLQELETRSLLGKNLASIFTMILSFLWTRGRGIGLPSHLCACLIQNKTTKVIQTNTDHLPLNQKDDYWEIFQMCFKVNFCYCY